MENSNMQAEPQEPGPMTWQQYRALIAALHAAIASPMGVVPKEAEAFYEQDHPALKRHRDNRK